MSSAGPLNRLFQSEAVLKPSEIAGCFSHHARQYNIRSDLFSRHRFTTIFSLSASGAALHLPARETRRSARAIILGLAGIAKVDITQNIVEFVVSSVD